MMEDGKTAATNGTGDGHTYRLVRVETAVHAGTSRSMNPTYRVRFIDGTCALTETDCEIGYGINNSEYRESDHVGRFTRQGRLISLTLPKDTSEYVRDQLGIGAHIYTVMFDRVTTETERFTVTADSPGAARLMIQSRFDANEITGEVTDSCITGNFDWDSLERAKGF